MVGVLTVAPGSSSTSPWSGRPFAKDWYNKSLVGLKSVIYPGVSEPVHDYELPARTRTKVKYTKFLIYYLTVYWRPRCIESRIRK